MKIGRFFKVRCRTANGEVILELRADTPSEARIKAHQRGFKVIEVIN